MLIQTGRSLALLGECVLGATVAEALRRRPGDALLSSPDNLFDLAESYLLKVSVGGVLHATHTPDDLAVFVDLKTAWIIHGLGHGHQDAATTADPQMILAQQQTNIVASAKLLPYIEITPDNLDTLRFHGDPSTFPLTAILTLPHDNKSAALLMSRYLSATSPMQIVKPSQAIAAALHHIFKIKRLFDAIFVVVSVAMVLAIVLILTLSFRLRQAEIGTVFKLGCSRRKVVELIAAELCLIMLMSLAVTIGLTVATAPWHAGLMQWLMQAE